jgi:hypothetical protein
MTDVRQADASRRFRSPPYPFIPLDKAVERIGQFHGKAHHHAVGVSVLADAWEFAVKSSGLWATAAALLQFGLLTDEGSGEKRKFQLTDAALRIVRDPNPASEKRRSAIRGAAMSPKIFKELWDKFGIGINTISDVVFKAWLTVDRHEAGLAPYSDTAADEVIKVYKATIAFAGLTDSVTLPEGKWEMDAQVENDLASMPQPEGGAMDPQTPNVRRESLGPGVAGERREIKDDISLLLQGNRLKINATVDADGIARLKKILDKYEEILKLLQ